MTERKTRYQINVLIDSKDTDSVEYGLATIFNKYSKDIFKSITTDNGSEFASLPTHLTDICKTYYCRAYTASDRGTNENQNRIIRRFIPKGVSLEHYTRQDIENITKYMNDKPRKILGYYTAEEMFKQELSKIKN